MKKTLEFSTKIDTSDFDRAVEQMQRKLKEIYRPADNAASQRATATRLEGLGLGGNLSKPTMDAYSKSINQTKVAMDKFIADQAKGMEYSAKLIAKQEDGMKKLRVAQQSITKDSKEYLEIQEKIQRTEANLNRQREQAAGRYKALNQGLDARQELDRPGGPGSSSVGRGMGRFAVGAIAAIGGTIGAVERFAGYPQRLEQARGSAIQGTVGQDLSRVYGGKSPFEQMYMPERKAAEGLSKEKEDWNRITDYAKSLLAVSSVAVGAGLSTTGAGAILGVPLMVGGVAALTNDRTRLAGGKEHEQLLASERASDFRSNLENLKNQDQAKKQVLEGYENNFRQDLGTQRTTGMNDFQMYGGGGFLNRAHRAGFMGDQAQQMAQGIVGAGGSARMGRNAEFGLQMERTGMTNASGVLGTLSGGISDPTQNKRATIAIMAEAFQIGLDNTTFAEENRRFTQSVATVIANTGAPTTADQDRISAMMGQFLGERTNKGVEAGGSAFEKFQQRGSQTSGRIGAIRWSMAMKDPFLSKLDPTDLQELLSAEPKDLRETDPMVKYLADQAGTTPKNILSSVGAGVKSTQFVGTPGRQKQAEAAASTMNDYIRKKGMTYAEFAEKANNGGNGLEPDSADALSAFGFLKLNKLKETQEKYTSRGATSAVGEMAEGATTQTLSEQKKGVIGSLEGVGERLGDLITKRGAEGEDEARYNLRQMSDELKAAATGVNTFAQAVSSAASTLTKQAPDKLGNMPQGTGLNLDVMSRFTGQGIPEPNQSVQPKGGVERK